MAESVPLDFHLILYSTSLTTTPHQVRNERSYEPITILLCTIYTVENVPEREPILLRFLQCQHTECVQIFIEDDGTAEYGERVIVNLEIPGSPENGIIPRETERVFTIIDNDGSLEFCPYNLQTYGL